MSKTWNQTAIEQAYSCFQELARLLGNTLLNKMTLSRDYRIGLLSQRPVWDCATNSVSLLSATDHRLSDESRLLSFAQ
jgi:hypothetical protein